MKMAAQGKENILERLESASGTYVLQHRERIKNMFALAERCGLGEELEWVPEKE